MLKECCSSCGHLKEDHALGTDTLYKCNDITGWDGILEEFEYCECKEYKD